MPFTFGDVAFLWDQILVLVVLNEEKYLVLAHKWIYQCVRHTPWLSSPPHALAQQNRN